MQGILKPNTTNAKSTRKKTSRQKLLSHTRPNTTATISSSNGPNSGTQPTQSSKHTRTTIRSYHTLQKRLHQARKAAHGGDAALIASLETQLSNLGGLEATKLRPPQAKHRNAAETRLGRMGTAAGQGNRDSNRNGILVKKLGPPLRILEVGALSTANALNVPGQTVVRRVDLRSTNPGIEERDFMTMNPSEKWQGTAGYDVLSLSLVVNFVGDPSARGDMLRHTTRFLRSPVSYAVGERANDDDNDEDGDDVDNHNDADAPKNNLQTFRHHKTHRFLATLFLVLPLPCVDNSRYLTEDRLIEMMESLDYVQTKVKRSSKLYFSLWRYRPHALDLGRARQQFKKEEVRGGKERNNFCIVLESATGEPRSTPTTVRHWLDDSSDASDSSAST
ncbi:uncharacterized protein AB675_9343 [Cyphellophora attinorum]|uniref:25S rRNA adenine-N(1) methyltransferase n=1 Tax=Cyphellophora attinorum TaxID=1664694 RepID=A0A0N1H6G4_9EURO|nr:uncharacterized protein AB675_9343 [Phialophora attinorum]KPI41622.1 hypothetical protein AB675_9343 [Phialophora attinorum]